MGRGNRSQANHGLSNEILIASSRTIARGPILKIRCYHIESGPLSGDRARPHSR